MNYKLNIDNVFQEQHTISDNTNENLYIAEWSDILSI